MLFLARAENKNKKCQRKYDCKESHIKDIKTRSDETIVILKNIRKVS